MTKRAKPNDETLSKERVNILKRLKSYRNN